MNRLRYLFYHLSIAGFLFLLFPSYPAHADGPILNVNGVRNSLYSNYDGIKKEIFQKHGALNPDGTVNKNAPGYKAAVGEITPYHEQMKDNAIKLGEQREKINEKIYEQSGAEKPQTSGTDSQKGGGRGGFGDAEGTAKSTSDYERIAKGFKEQGYHVDRQPDYIKIDELDTVIHRPAGKTDAVGSSAHEARVTAQTQGPETAGSAYGQKNYQGQGGQYAAQDKMGAGLDSIKKIQDAVNADPQTPWEKYQRDQVIAKETNRIREAAGMEKDPHLASVKEGMDPDLIPEIKDPVKQTALDQAKSAWPKIEENNQKNLADLDQAISNAKTPEDAHKLMAEKNDLLRRQEGTKKAIFEKDGGKAFEKITGKEPASGKPLSETAVTSDEPAAGGKETVKVKKPETPEATPGKTPGLFDNHPIEKNIKPYFNGEPGKVTEIMETHGGKITLVLTAAQTVNCLAQGKTVGQCAEELVEGFAIGTGFVIVLGPTGATILGGVAGAYQIYAAGVEATQQWADAQQRKAAYENRDKQTKYNLENLDKYINDFREKKINGELKASSDIASEACLVIDRQVQSAANSPFEEYGSDNTYNLSDLLAAIRKASVSCKEAAAMTGEIADLRSKSKTYEDTVIKGLDWSRERADKCGSAEDANKVRDMYNKCTNLAASLKGYSILAKEKNAKIVQAIEKGNEAAAALPTAQAMTVKIIGRAASVESIKNSIQPQIGIAVEKKNAHIARCDSMLAEIDELRKGFPDILLPANEAKFTELRGLIVQYKTLACNPETGDWLTRIDEANKRMNALAGNARRLLEEAKAVSSSCGNITSSDQAVESVDASANWVLTAIGMNEDLPQKADACLTKLNVQKESRLMAAKCPANSTSVWNEKTKEAQCQCSKGFKWDDAHAACLVDKTAQIAAAKCWPGSEAYWNEKMNAVGCRCTKGLKWNAERNACIVDKAAQVAAADCSGTPNSRPYWDEKQNQVLCLHCNPGFKWRDSSSLECVSEKAAQVAAADCSGTPNSRPYWDEKQNQVLCLHCNPGFKWRDSSSLECVSEKAAQVAAADCSGTPNSRPYWDEKQNQVLCLYCNPGFKWRDSSSLECVSEKAAQVAAADCSGTPNSRPYWDDEHNSVRCKYCNGGFHWRDGSGLDCVC